jgi:hypothetical protein
MSYKIVINQSNVSKYNNYTYEYNFINSGIDFPEGSEIAIKQITVPYSWYNFTAALGNNVLTYYLPNGIGTQVAYSTTLNDGWYDTAELNSIMQTTMRNNGHFWFSAAKTAFSGSITSNVLTVLTTTVLLSIGQTISYIYLGTLYTTAITGYGVTAQTYTVGITGGTSGAATPMTAQNTNVGTLSPSSFIYPLSIATYNHNYTNQITAITIPIFSNIISTFGTNYLVSSNWSSYPTSSGTCGYISIPTTTPNTYTLGNFLGYATGNYPSTITGLSAYSQVINGNSLQQAIPFASEGTFVNDIVLRCNLVDNYIGFPTDILESIPITATFGSNINYIPSNDIYMKMKSGRFTKMTLTFQDQSFNNLLMNDSNILVTLLIRMPKINK